MQTHVYVFDQSMEHGQRASIEMPLCRMMHRSFFLLDALGKASLPVALGHMIASSPLESLVMAGDINSQGMNMLQGYLAVMFPVSWEERSQTSRTRVHYENKGSKEMLWLKRGAVRSAFTTC